MKKEAAMERLRYTMKTTDHYKNVQRTLRRFSSIRLPVIKQINKFIEEIIMYMVHPSGFVPGTEKDDWV